MPTMNYELSGDERLPLYQRLTESIRMAIVNQQWLPGDRLPSETDLAEKYKVAPGTMRQAITQLVQEKLLERRQGSGTFVRRPTFDSSLFRFFRFESKDGVRQIPESRIIHREVIQAPSHIQSALNVKPNAEVISMTRLRLLDNEPVMFEDIWLDYSIFNKFIEMEEEEIGPLLYPIYDSHFNQFVIRAKESLLVELADDSFAKMLRIAPKSPVIVIDRTAYGIDGKAIEWRRSRALADHFSYNIEIS